MRRGRLIAVSGVDGSGKSTLVAGLTGRLEEEGRSVLSVPALKPRGASPVAWAHDIPDPGDTTARERWIAGYFTLVLAANTAETILPALQRGEWVVTDRWALDHLANQRSFDIGLEEWQPWLKALPQPDCHLLVDVSPDIAAERITARGKDLGVGRGEPFLTRCRDHMLTLARQGSQGAVHVVDGSRDAEAVLAAAETLVQALDRTGRQR